MKYNSILIRGDSVDLDVACSECGTPVGPDSKYCSECGHRLCRIPTEMTTKKLLSILNSQGRFPDSEKTVPENNDPMLNTPSGRDEGPQIRCTLGKTASEAPSCPHRIAGGCCGGYSYLTFPPQPGECPFSSKSTGHLSAHKYPFDPGWFRKGDLLQDF